MEGPDQEEDSGAAVNGIHGTLIMAGVLAPLVLGGDEERLWTDVDLASLAENRLGDMTEPGGIDSKHRKMWRLRAGACRLPSQRKSETCFWLLNGGERVGTVALAKSAFTSYFFGFSRELGLSSLYVFQSQRRKGIATRALERIRHVAFSKQMGIRLTTHWNWQGAVGLYLKSGFWLLMWKHDLTFRCRPDLPRPLVKIGDKSASLSVDLDGQRVLLAHANRENDRLVRFEPTPSEEMDGRIFDLTWQAWSTLSLNIALRRWPLIRSQAAWKARRFSDCGPPEALAYKIPSGMRGINSKAGMS